MNILQSKATKLVYILGSGHSGSTLLDLMLGSHASLESVGEIKSLPQFVSPSSTRPREKQFCTCGVHITDCEYWGGVFSKLSNDTAWRIDQPETFDEHNRDLLSAILEHSGKTVIVDSSKSVARLSRLIDCGCFEITVIHLIRDGRAVAFSNKRKANRSIYKQANQWAISNMQQHRQFSNLDFVDYLLVRYEDFVRSPQTTLTAILSRLGLQFESSQLRFWEFTHHNISGNRVRTVGPVELSEDTEYKEKMSRLEWLTCTLRARKALKRFGYRLSRG